MSDDDTMPDDIFGDAATDVSHPPSGTPTSDDLGKAPAGPASSAQARVGQRIDVTGIVQGVGFRPFVFNLAQRLALRGQVRNTETGVEIIILGDGTAIERFLHELTHHAPPLAQIDTIETQPLSPDEYATAHSTDNFTIAPSAPHKSGAATFVPVSPDVALCAECRSELLDTADRRYRYPFINCTNCGPRYTIIRDVPYDRPATTMADFPLCSACRREYENPGDRRFHAQPNACPLCGPQLSFVQGSEANHAAEHTPKRTADSIKEAQGEAALRAAQRALGAGKIVAVKGIGGFHLACDATNAQAVETLRARKDRQHKPFALMVASVEIARRFAHISPLAHAHLTSPAAPIVLLPTRADSALPASIAPGNHRLGIMLPYSPLHHLLFLPPANPVSAYSSHAGGFQPPSVLVMTSGNVSEEPIAIDNAEAQARLGMLADAFLFHNRPIHIACDDSVLTLAESSPADPPQSEQDAQPILIRRSRGYAPTPISLPFDVQPVLATGGELKNTLCVTRARRAFLSGHIGNLANLETLRAFEHAVEHMKSLFRVEPQAVVCDLHPGYLGTTWAQEYARTAGIPLIRVQHHHAHIAALMAEHQLPRDAQIIGVALDGTGYGPDGTIWGGEFLVADYTGYQRQGRLRPLPLPGGDASIHRPYRMALAALWQCGLAWDESLPPVAVCPPAERTLLRQQLARDFNCVPTSSMGRFFDTIAALIGVCTLATYEAQGAIELEALAAGHRRVEHHLRPMSLDLSYPFRIQSIGHKAQPPNLGHSPPDHVQFEATFEIDTQPIIRAVTQAVQARVAKAKTRGAILDHDWQATIAWRTHETVAAMIEAGCQATRRHTGLNRVGLTGGVFQNATLLALTQQRLAHAGFQTLMHRQLPPNDGGLALGQAVIAGARLAAPDAVGEI